MPEREPEPRDRESPRATPPDASSKFARTRTSASLVAFSSYSFDPQQNVGDDKLADRAGTDRLATVKVDGGIATTTCRSPPQKAPLVAFLRRGVALLGPVTDQTTSSITRSVRRFSSATRCATSALDRPTSASRRLEATTESGPLLDIELYPPPRPLHALQLRHRSAAGPEPDRQGRAGRLPLDHKKQPDHRRVLGRLTTDEKSSQVDMLRTRRAVVAEALIPNDLMRVTRTSAGHDVRGRQCALTASCRSPTTEPARRTG